MCTYRLSVKAWFRFKQSLKSSQRLYKCDTCTKGRKKTLKLVLSVQLDIYISFAVLLNNSETYGTHKSNAAFVRALQ